MGDDTKLIDLTVLLGAPLLTYLLVSWAGRIRKISKSAVLAVLLLGFGMIPDPLYERIIRVVQKVKESEQENQDEDGDVYS